MQLFVRLCIAFFFGSFFRYLGFYPGPAAFFHALQTVARSFFSIFFENFLRWVFFLFFDRSVKLLAFLFFFSLLNVVFLLAPRMTVPFFVSFPFPPFFPSILNDQKLVTIWAANPKRRVGPADDQFDLAGLFFNYFFSFSRLFSKLFRSILAIFVSLYCVAASVMRFFFFL